METIEIDWDIHKAIENERRGFDENPRLALRRLLGLPEPKAEPSKGSLTTSSGIDWAEDGVVVPHGSAARMIYNHGRQTIEGQFLDGKLVVNGKGYKSLSAAARHSARTKAGRKPSLNGWHYWEVQLPGESKWTRMGDLRDANYR